VRPGPDRSREFGIDQVLHAPLEQPAEQVLGVSVAQSTDQVGNSGIIVTGHRVVSFSEFLRRSHQESRDDPPHRVDPATYTTSWDANRAVLVGPGLFGTDLGTHDSVEMAMQAAEDRWQGRA
jgi:hypothetical protein